MEKKCIPLKYHEVLKASDAMDLAFRDDPLHNYIKDSPNVTISPFMKQRDRLLRSIMFSDAIRRNEAVTLDAGDAVVSFKAAPKSLSCGRRLLDRIVGFVKTGVFLVLLRTFTREQRLRMQESDDKLKSTIQDALGDRLENMISLDVLFNHPEKRGRGYGSHLADAEARAVWLASSNIANTGFYESLGFSTISEVTLGESNPTWTKSPIVVRLMAREPASAANAMLWTKKQLET